MTNLYKYRTIVLLFLMLAGTVVHAATVDTVATTSMAMNKTIPAVVIKPDDYETVKELPVIYMLHGWSGNYSDYIKKINGFAGLADAYQVIIVCADGGYGSWYWDSPVDTAYQYETYIAKELVKWIDDRYKTIHDKSGRAIIGLSMGGQGALYLAIRHQDVFGAAGSMSGGVDIRPFPDNWDLAKRLGKYSEQKERWDQYAVTNMLGQLSPGALAINIDCGSEDFFYKVNETLHDKLLLAHIPHDYSIRPGGHNWPYWNRAVAYQFLFMNDYFKRRNK